jgi:hypothetical protein
MNNLVEFNKVSKVFESSTDNGDGVWFKVSSTLDYDVETNQPVGGEEKLIYEPIENRDALIELHIKLNQALEKHGKIMLPM